MTQKIFTVTVSSAFTATHRHDKTLNEAEHPHDFKYSITLKGPLNEEGYIADFREIESSLKAVNKKLEGNSLNDLLRYPTTENLASYILDEMRKKFPQAVKVTVREKENFYAACEIQ